MNKNIFIILMAVVLNSCTNAQTKQKANLSALEFSEQIKDKKNIQLIDVRTPEEFEKGHLEDAININWYGNDFDTQVSRLDKSKPVFVYCLSGGRSGSAADKMRKAGFEKVFEMPGGMMEWRANNLPETRINASGMNLGQYQSLLQSDKLVLIDFYAEWCAPCKKMKPYLEKIAVDMVDKVTLIRIDADENSQLCKELGVAALPVLKLYKSQTLLWEHEGFIDEENVRKQLNR